jgi:hypothetical protein
MSTAIENQNRKRYESAFSDLPTAEQKTLFELMTTKNAIKKLEQNKKLLLKFL